MQARGRLNIRIQKDTNSNFNFKDSRSTLEHPRLVPCNLKLHQEKIFTHSLEDYRSRRSPSSDKSWFDGIFLDDPGWEQFAYQTRSSMRENLMHSLVNRYPLALLLSEGKIPLEFREIFRHIADCKKTAKRLLQSTPQWQPITLNPWRTRKLHLTSRSKKIWKKK